LLFSVIHTGTQDICLYIKLIEGIAVYQGGGYQDCGLKGWNNVQFFRCSGYQPLRCHIHEIFSLKTSIQL